MEKQLINKRSYGIDFLKYLCAFMVVLIHTEYFLKPYILPMLRVAVPIFFMITGYFYTNTKKHKKELKQLLGIFKLLLFGCIVYFVSRVFWGMDANSYSFIEMVEYIGFTTGKYWYELLLFNSSFCGGHLWYLFALIYVLAFIYLFEKKWDRKYLYYLIPILILGNVILGQYSALVFGKSLPVFISRNFLFTGLPHFLMGDLLYRYRDKISFNNLTLSILLIVSIVATYLENLYSNGTGEYFFNTFLVSVFAFLLVIKNDSKFSKKALNIIALWGKNYSALIYILHIVIIDNFNNVFINKLEIDGTVKSVYTLILPIVVLFVTTIISWIIKSVQKVLTEKMNNKKATI